MAESQPSKLLVAGSIPVARSSKERAHVAQLAERVLGKDEVSSSILLVGSTLKDHITSSGERNAHGQAEIRA